LTIRLPDDKHERLKALAKSNSISINTLMDDLATVALANDDARVRLETRAARGNPKRALALLDKLDRVGSSRQRRPTPVTIVLVHGAAPADLSGRRRFAQHMQERAEPLRLEATDVPRPQRRSALQGTRSTLAAESPESPCVRAVDRCGNRCRASTHDMARTAQTCEPGRHPPMKPARCHTARTTF
jgi:hypothetical protein